MARVLHSVPGFQPKAVYTLHTVGRKPLAAVCFFMNLSNVAAFRGNESPGRVRERERLLGRHTQQPCSEQFVSIRKKKTRGTVNKSKSDRTAFMTDAHVHFVIPCSHLIKQRLPLQFPWQPHAPWPKGLCMQPGFHQGSP